MFLGLVQLLLLQVLFYIVGYLHGKEDSNVNIKQEYILPVPNNRQYITPIVEIEKGLISA